VFSVTQTYCSFILLYLFFVASHMSNQKRLRSDSFDQSTDSTVHAGSDMHADQLPQQQRQGSTGPRISTSNPYATAPRGTTAAHGAAEDAPRVVNEAEAQAAAAIRDMYPQRTDDVYRRQPMLSSVYGHSTQGSPNVYVQRPLTYNFCNLSASSTIKFVTSSGMRLNAGISMVDPPQLGRASISMHALNRLYAANEDLSQDNYLHAVDHVLAAGVLDPASAQTPELAGRILDLQYALLAELGRLALPYENLHLGEYVNMDELRAAATALTARWPDKQYAVQYVYFAAMGMPHTVTSRPCIAPMARSSRVGPELTLYMRNPMSLLNADLPDDYESTATGYALPLPSFGWTASFNAELRADRAIFEAEPQIGLVPIVVLDRFTPAVLGALLYAAAFPCFELLAKAASDLRMRIELVLTQLCALNGFDAAAVHDAYDRCGTSFSQQAYEVLQMGKPSQNFKRFDDIMVVFIRQHPEIAGNQTFVEQLRLATSPRAAADAAGVGYGPGSGYGRQPASGYWRGQGRGTFARHSPAPAHAPLPGPRSFHRPSEQDVAAMTSTFRQMHAPSTTPHVRSSRAPAGRVSSQPGSAPAAYPPARQ